MIYRNDNSLSHSVNQESERCPIKYLKSFDHILPRTKHDATGDSERRSFIFTPEYSECCVECMLFSRDYIELYLID